MTATAEKPKRPRGRPRIHPSDKARKAAYVERKRTAKRGAAIVENTPDTSNDRPLTVSAKVVEEAAPTLDIPTPIHTEGNGVPEAGTESGVASTSTTATAGTPGAAEPTPALDPKVMVSLTKGVFALIALRAGEHWKVEEEEIEPIAEPMCRQAARIPIVAALGQDAADLILIGSTLGALIFMRAEQTIAQRKAQTERRVQSGTGQVIELRPERGQTERVPEASAGERYQEVREPGEPGVNLGPFRASG